jgi:hypothetical protein
MQLQRDMGAAIFRSLTPAEKMQKTWVDGSPTSQFVSRFIKPNDRLSSFERLEIYNRQYWFRLIDLVFEDFPGLRAILGDVRFGKLARAYLGKYPSQSYSLRNLTLRMAKFLEEEPKYAGSRAAIAIEMARFELAQVEAFDGPQKPPLKPVDLAGHAPSRVKLALQPYITILEMNYPLDDFVLAIKRNSLRADASNAVDELEVRKGKPVKLPKKQKTWLAVHRADLSVYYKRLDPAAYHILCALRDGMDLEGACGHAVDMTGTDNWSGRVGDWFKLWMQMGWFCRRG